ncbi:MAG: Uma2 family endonuclease [Bacteroidia bacterium]
MAHPAIKHKKYSYADYLQWDDDKRWEIINGEAYDMSPAPNTKHQRILLKLSQKIYNYLQDKSCEIFVAPFDVRLSKQSDEDFEIFNVVQPDISVFCDKKKIDSKGAKGAPDWIIEILSPSTSKKDTTKKLVLYQNFQVKEYWIVDPEDETVSVFLLNKQNIFSKVTEYKKKEPIPVKIFTGFKIKGSEIF